MSADDGLPSGLEPALRLQPRRFEGLVFIGIVSKLALSRLDPIVQPRQKIVMGDSLSPQTNDDFSHGERGNSFLCRALKKPASSRDLKQLQNIRACLWIAAEEKVLDLRVDELCPNRRSGWGVPRCSLYFPERSPTTMSPVLTVPPRAS
jgi:hypothetical protein